MTDEPEGATSVLAALEGPQQELDHAHQAHGVALMRGENVEAAEARLVAAQDAHAAHQAEHGPDLARKIDTAAQAVIDARKGSTDA